MQQMFVSRRRLLQLSGIGIGAATLAACMSPAQPVPTAVPTETPTTAPTAAVPPTPTAAVALFNGLPHGITAEGFPYLGDPDAPITMIDYSDFL